MVPKKITYTLAAPDTDGFMVNVTDAINTTPWTTVAGSPSDGCAHLASLSSTANLSAITITLTGTDADGRVQTDSLAGPNNNTVNFAKYFKTVTSITASGTLGSNTMDVGWTAVAVTPSYATSVYPEAGPLIGVDVGATTCNYTVQQTNDQVFDYTPTLWTTLQAAGDVNTLSQGLIGVTAHRVLVNSHTSGVIKLTMSQACS